MPSDKVRDVKIEAKSRPMFRAEAGPVGAPAIAEDLLTGSRELRRAFLQTPIRYAARDVPLIRLGERDASLILLRSGFAFRSYLLADGKRAILDLLVPGDFAGLDHIVMATPVAEITAASRVGYHALDPASARKLLDDRSVALRIVALAAEARWRSDRLAAMIGRLDAEARIAALILGVYDRLRRRGLINQMSFNLPLTQEQIADHLGLTLVHVNRTLRRMREERLVIVDRQVVIIMDLEGLRQLVRGLPQAADIPEPAMPPERAPLGG
jgi:CRP-like cAMP-binding protein